MFWKRLKFITLSANAEKIKEIRETVKFQKIPWTKFATNVIFSEVSDKNLMLSMKLLPLHGYFCQFTKLFMVAVYKNNYEQLLCK